MSGDFSKGLFLSLVGHVVLFSFLAGNHTRDLSDFGKPMIYSVSIEGGEKIGGIAQVPEKDSKPDKAPPKKVQSPPEEKEPEPEPEKEEEPPVEDKKEEVPQEEVEDAEVSLSEKEKATPTPEPKKTKPKPKPKPKPKSTPKPKPKPKPKPVVKPKPKPKPKPKEPSLAEINKRLQQAVQRYTGESTDAGGQGFGSAGGGAGSGLGGGVTRPPEFFRYQSVLESYIKSGWRWHDTRENLNARVCFKISAEGRLSDIRLCGSSGNGNFDDSVIRAVTKADPVPSPPESVYSFFREVRLTFSPLE